MNEQLNRQIIIRRGETGWFVAECPSLPGCISQGRTHDEALNNMREAIDLHIEGLLEEGLPVPEERYETRLVSV